MAKCISTKIFRVGHLKKLLVTVVILLLSVKPTAQVTSCEPVNIGLIAALPWDVANTLRAPIGGPVSLALSVVLALALVFGFLLAPVNYILGYPSRIYHPARRPGLISDLLYSEGSKLSEMVTSITNKATDDLFRDGNDAMESRKFSDQFDPTAHLNTYGNGGVRKTDSYPDFMSSAFFIIPEDDTECRKLILCHAHGFLPIFPVRFTKFIRFLSKRMAFIPQEYQQAVILGLSNQSECQNVFKCSKNISVLLKDVLYNLLSTETKDFWKLQKMF